MTRGCAEAGLPNTGIPRLTVLRHAACKRTLTAPIRERVQRGDVADAGKSTLQSILENLRDAAVGPAIRADGLHAGARSTVAEPEPRLASIDAVFFGPPIAREARSG